jgi:hypothetical protein
VTCDGTCIHGFQQRAAPVVVEHQGAAVVGHLCLHIEQGRTLHASVVLMHSAAMPWVSMPSLKYRIFPLLSGNYNKWACDMKVYVR